MKTKNEEKTLIDLAVEAFRKGITHEFEKEDRDDDYLNQRDFDSCEDRMRVAANNAIEAPIKVLALGAVLHRNSKSHGDNRGIEEEALRVQIEPETIAAIEKTPEVTGEARSFWMA